MRTNTIAVFFTLALLLACNQEPAGEFDTEPAFKYQDTEPRWVSFENITGEKGKGGMENQGAKGHAFDGIDAGGSKTILDIEGPGIINRIWMTVQNRSGMDLRGLVIRMYWDGEEKPAVSAPLGDFFGVGLGRTATFENALFANPEGRSFNSFIQMPFRRSARIEIVNELDYPLGMLFYDVDLQLLDRWDDSYLYFHCFWHRDTSTVLARDFEILPHVEGKGRFLGTNVSVVSDPVYENAWWGEGEVKVYLNGDTDFATLVGTGTEDYIGTAWGQGAYTTMYTGCPVADDANRQWAYYRYHIKDPVYFKTDCRVTVQVMGGSSKQHVMDLLEKGAGLLPVQIIHENDLVNFYREDTIQDLRDPAIPAEGWVNFYRSDDYAAAAYFYLDRPSNGLPDLQGLEVRTWNLK